MPKLSDKKKQLLKEAYEYCNENDKSTEYMLQYMQDFAKCSLNQVIFYLQTETN